MQSLWAQGVYFWKEVLRELAHGRGQGMLSDKVPSMAARAKIHAK
jgi:hypothetical protein